MELTDSGARFKWSFGVILALGVIIIALVLGLMDKMTWQSAGLFIALGLARLS